jgi:hypothetical protein
MALGHGESGQRRVPATAEYVAWKSMIARCESRHYPSRHRYGGRGIKVCPEWRHDYPAFLLHVGRRPSAGHSLDRFPNPDGDYEPGNVRWATASQQQKNKGLAILNQKT